VERPRRLLESQNEAFDYRQMRWWETELRDLDKLGHGGI
jgi:hypothetical protein